MCFDIVFLKVIKQYHMSIKHYNKGIQMKEALKVWKLQDFLGIQKQWEILRINENKEECSFIICMLFMCIMHMQHMQWISGVYDSQAYSFETGFLSVLARLVPQRACGILLYVTQFWSACSQANIFRGVGDSKHEVLMLRSKHSNTLSHHSTPKGVYFINSKISIKSWYNEAGEMSQWFRAVAAFPEDMGFDSQNPMAAHKHP